MSRNSQYFVHKELLSMKAAETIKYYEQNHAEEIANSINNTILYDFQGKENELEYLNSRELKAKEHYVILKSKTTVGTIESVAKRNGKVSERFGKIAVLNFASYKHPGGMFLKGSSAQEESLCHNSDLYPILNGYNNITGYYTENKSRLNHGFYEHRALYTPDVLFYINGKKYFVNVITCAAPNIGSKSAIEYEKEHPGTNEKILRERLLLIRHICAENKIDTLITGPFGCGVFKQDPRVVAPYSKDIFDTPGTELKNVIYSLPQGHGSFAYNSIVFVGTFAEYIVSESFNLSIVNFTSSAVNFCPSDQFLSSLNFIRYELC